MGESISKKTVALNEIFMELYAKKENISIKDIQTGDTPYKNFVKDNTKKLKETFNAIKCDIEQFKNGKDRYDLPIVVAEIFKIYLTEESGKGSYISKLKNRRFLDITIEEKVDFINKVTDRLREIYKGDIDEQKVHRELEDLHRRWLGEANYSEEVKAKILDTELCTNLLIESAMIHVGSISELDGLITVNNEKLYADIEEDMFEKINEVDNVKTSYSEKLTHDDRLELLTYLKYFIIKNIKEWRKIVDIAWELREDNITESALENEEILASKDLVKLAIQEYEDEVKENMKPNVVVKHSPEEMKKILEEIRQNLENRKKYN